MAHIGHGVSIWPYVVTRAEMHETIIGENCPITHRAVLHGCMVVSRKWWKFSGGVLRAF